MGSQYGASGGTDLIKLIRFDKPLFHPYRSEGMCDSIMTIKYKLRGQRHSGESLTGFRFGGVQASLLFCLFFLAFHDTRPAFADAGVLARADQLVEAQNLDGAREVLEAFLESQAETAPVWLRLRQIYVALARQNLARSLDLPRTEAVGGSGLNSADPKTGASIPQIRGNAESITPPPRAIAGTSSTSTGFGQTSTPTSVAPAPVVTPAPVAAASAPRPSSNDRGQAAATASVAPAPVVTPAPVAAAPAPRPSSNDRGQAAATASVAPAPVVTPAPVAAAPAPSQVPQAAVATPPQTPASVAPAVSVLERRTTDWARAWTSRDLGQYLSFYARDFVGTGSLTRDGWVESRRQALERAQGLDVRLERMTVRPISATRAQVRFWQRFRSTGLSVNTWKTLEWALEGNRWVIVSETTSSAGR